MSASLLHDSAVDVMVAVIQNMVLTKMGEGEGASERASERERERQRQRQTDRGGGGVLVATLVTVMDAISTVGDGGVTETSSNDLTYNL